MAQTKVEIQKKLESAKRYATDLEKDLKVCRDRNHELEEKQKPTKQWTIKIAEQTHWRKDFASAKELAAKLIDLGVWWVSLTHEDH